MCLEGKTEGNEDHDMATVLERELHTPEVNYNYVNTSVMLSRGDRYSRGKVIELKIDTDGNAVGRENYNPILDTRKYPV